MPERASIMKPVQLEGVPSDRVTRRGVLSMVGTVTQGLVRFLTTWIPARGFLTKGAVGHLGSGISMANLASLMWPVSLGAAASKFIGRARGAGDTDLVRAIAAQLGRRTMQSAALVSVLAALVWLLLGESIIEAPVIIALVLGYAGYNFTRGLHFALGQTQRGTTWDVITSTVGVVGLVVLLFLGVTNMYVALPIAASQLAYTAACWPYGGRGTVARELRREIDAFVTIGSVGSLASLGMMQAAIWVVKLGGGEWAAGGYTAAMTLTSPLAMVATSISLVLYPSMAEAYGRSDEGAVRRQTDLALRGLVAVVIVMYGSVAILSRIFMKVYKAEYAADSVLIPVFCLGLAATNMATPCVSSLTSRNQKGMYVTLTASQVGLVSAIAFWLLFARNGSPLRVAAGYALGMIIMASISFIVVWRRESQQWLGVVVKIVVGMGLAATIVMLQRRYLTNPWFDAAGAVVFVLVWSALNLRQIRRLLAVVQKAKPTVA